MGRKQLKGVGGQLKGPFKLYQCLTGGKMFAGGIVERRNGKVVNVSTTLVKERR